jgi:hypothetical protein
MHPDNRVVRIIAERPDEYELPNPVHAFDDVEEERDSTASMIAAGVIGWGLVLAIVFVILFLG